MGDELLSVERLREVLDYDPETGVFKWKVKINRNIVVGSTAGGLHPKGYWRIAVDGKRYLAHRLAYLYINGEWPDDQVDHRDRNRINNRWNNLRPASQTQQNGNTNMNKNNSSGARGVCWDKSRTKWLAFINVNDRFKNLGRFDEFEDAREAHGIAAIEHFGEEFART